MSLVQSRCRLDLVQHHSPIRFGRETSNKFSVIKLQKNVHVFLHWCQQQNFISRCWPTVEWSFDFTKASLENPQSVGLMEPGFVASGAGQIWKWRVEIFFVTVSTVCCLQFKVPHAVGATVCASVCLGGSDKSLTLAALTRLFGSAWAPTHISSLLQPLPHPPFF